ncbi:MAG: hypothetical protein CVV27_05970 [Candidatus Melainabacteria bacterium HGW-Melainabacteria-1]|nr:MAG: hypothetical protein CVV27_05970 [Candidatus Melainabacteria bacterium HGW-Melainabacteria-1]
MQFKTGPLNPLQRFENQGMRISTDELAPREETAAAAVQDTQPKQVLQDQGQTRQFARLEFQQEVSFDQTQPPDPEHEATSPAVQFGSQENSDQSIRRQLSSTRSEIRELNQQIQLLEASLDHKGLFNNRRQLGQQLAEAQAKLTKLEQQETQLEQILRIPEIQAAYKALDVNTEMTTDMRKQQVSSRAQNAIDVIEYHRLPPAGRPAGEAPQLKLDQGMDLVYTSLISGFNNPEKTQAARTLFQQLQTTPDMSLSPEQEQLLEDYGMVRDVQGQLINYMNKQPVSSQDLSDFTQIIDHQIRQFLLADRTNFVGNTFNIIGDLAGISDRVINPYAHSSAQASSQVIQGSSIGVSDQALQHLQNSQADLRANLAAVKAETVALREQLGRAQETITQLQTQKSQVETEIQVSEDFIRTFNGLETAEDFATFVRHASPEQLAWMQQQGLEVQQSAGQIVLRLNGENIDSVAALTFLKAQATEQHDALAARLRSLESQITQAEAAVHGVRDRLEALNTSESQLNGSMAEHDEAVAGARAERDRLLAIKNDPAAWAALSPQEQVEIDNLLAQYGAALSDSEALQTEAVQLLTAVNHLQAEAEAFIQDAEQIIADARRVFAQGTAVLQNLAHLLSALDQQLEKAHQAKDVEASAAIAKANELASRLLLAPQLNRTDVNTLLNDLQDILAEANRTYHRLSAEMSHSQTIERTRMQLFSDRLREMHEYTQDYLQNINSMRSEDIEQIRSQLQNLDQVML